MSSLGASVVHRPNGCRDAVFISFRLFSAQLPSVPLNTRSESVVVPRRIHVLFSYTFTLLVDFVYPHLLYPPP